MGSSVSVVSNLWQEKTMKLEIYQVDAFTSKPFAGNPAAVVPLESWLPDETMLNIAAENNLAETAFFVKNGDGFDLRWFTPTVEMDLCGHATVASAYVLYELLGFAEPIIKFQTKSGELRVMRDVGLFVLDFPARPPVDCETPAGLAEALGGEPQRVLKARDYLAIYASEADVLALRPDFRAIQAGRSRRDRHGPGRDERTLFRVSLHRRSVLTRTR